MKEPTSVQFNFRCPEALVELIEKDILSTGEYRNKSEWTLAAIRYFLEYRAKIIAERKAAFEDPNCDFSSSSGLYAADQVKNFQEE